MSKVEVLTTALHNTCQTNGKGKTVTCAVKFRIIQQFVDNRQIPHLRLINTRYST